MSAIASQITSLAIVYSIVYSDADQRKHSTASLAFVRGIHRGPVNSPHKGPVTRKMFPVDDIIMKTNWPFADDISKYNLLNEKFLHFQADTKWPLFCRHLQTHFCMKIVVFFCFVCMIQISLQFVPIYPLNTMPALALMMACRRSGNKPWYEAKMASLIC